MKAEQITEKGQRLSQSRRGSAKFEKKITNKAIRKLPYSLGKWITKRTVIKGWAD